MSLRFRVIQPPRLRAIVARGVAGPPGESAEASPIPANTALGNFTEATALPTAQTKSAWIEWLDVPTNFAFGGLSATVVDLAGELVALESVVDTKIGATNDTFLPVGNTFTIGNDTNAQRIRLRRRFVSAGDFSQLSIGWSGDNCQIQTQQAGNTPNPLILGTNGFDRVFIDAMASRIGIGASPTTRQLELHDARPSARFQVTSVTTPPTYTEAARCFEVYTFQDSTSPFNTCTDLVANSNQFNAHSIRVFVHANGTSAPLFSTMFYQTGRVGIGSEVDNNLGRLQIVQDNTGGQALSHLTFRGTWNTTGAPTAFDINQTDTASNAASLLMNLRTNGVSRFSVRKDGLVTTAGGITANDNSQIRRLGIGLGTPDLSALHLHVIDASADIVGFYVQNTSDVSSTGSPRIAIGHGGPTAFGVTAWQNRSFIEGQGSNGLVFGGQGASGAPVRIYSNRTNWNTGITLTTGNRVLVGTDVDNGADRLQVNGNATFASSASINFGSSSLGFLSLGYGIQTRVGGASVSQTDSAGLRFQSNRLVGWAAGSNADTPSDTALGRNAAGVVEINNGTAGTLRDLSLRNITSSGTLTLGGATDVLIPSAPSTRETIFRARISDAGNDAFHIYNATTADGSFAAGFSGSRFSSNLFAMGFIAQTDAANDTGNEPMMIFEARRTSSLTDPNNGTLSAITTRPLFRWQTWTNNWMQMFANGNLALNSITDSGAKLQVNVASGAGILNIISGQVGGTERFVVRQGASGDMQFIVTESVDNDNGCYFIQRQGESFSRAVFSRGHLGFGPGSTTRDTFIRRVSAGVWGLGTAFDNSLGSLQLANLAASGAVNTATVQNGQSRVELDPGQGNIRLVNGSVVRFAVDATGETLIGLGGGTARLNFGGSNSSFPGLHRSGTQLRCRLADQSGDAPFSAGAITASGHITSAFQSLSADPSTIDLASGMHRVVKNTTSGEVRDWVNDGGIMKKSPAYT